MKAYVQRVLQRGPATVETIASELQITTPEALQALTLLELEGQVEEVGGRYRLVNLDKPGQTSSKGRGKPARAKSSGEPVKSREICRVVWFDEKGRFAKAPKPLEPVEPIKPKVWRKTSESVKLEDGGRASIQRLGAGQGNVLSAQGDAGGGEGGQGQGRYSVSRGLSAVEGSRRAGNSGGCKALG